MEVEVGFSKVVCGKEVVQHTNDAVSSLPCIDSFVNEVVDLLKIFRLSKGECFLIKLHLLVWVLPHNTHRKWHIFEV